MLGAGCLERQCKAAPVAGTGPADLGMEFSESEEPQGVPRSVSTLLAQPDVLSGETFLSSSFSEVQPSL